MKTLRRQVHAQHVLLQRGTSMIELLITGAVVAILATFAGPTMADMQAGYQLSGASLEIFSALQRARMAAVMENNRYRVTIIDESNYQIHDDDDGDGLEDAGEMVTSASILTDNPGQSLSATGSFTFVPTGVVVTPGTVTVAGAAGSRTVVVSTAGRIRIQ